MHVELRLNHHELEELAYLQPLNAASIVHPTIGGLSLRAEVPKYNASTQSHDLYPNIEKLHAPYLGALQAQSLVLQIIVAL